jgi:ProP effector
MNRNQLHPKTATLNQKEKHVAKQLRFEALDWLANKFPAAFDNRTQIRPLKIGIMKDILHYAEEALSQGISKSKLREAVVVYTRRIDYLTCLKAKEVRIDLLGKPGEPVTAEEAERATQKIKTRVEKATKHAQNATKKASRAPSHSRELTPKFVSERSSTYTQQSKPGSGPSITIKRKFQTPAEAVMINRLKEKLLIE